MQNVYPYLSTWCLAKQIANQPVLLTRVAYSNLIVQTTEDEVLNGVWCTHF